MSVVPIQIPIPSLLAEDTEEWVRSFALRLRDEVVRPLFAAPNPQTFSELLPDALVRGATLRFRWLNALSGRSPETRRDLLDVWSRPPAPAFLEELQRLARELLGDGRSFQLRRALAMTFTDGLEGSRVLSEKLSAEQLRPERLIEMAALLEASAPHDVLSLAWMMVLLGDVPPPNIDVAEAAAAELLSRTAIRAGTLQRALQDEHPANVSKIDGTPIPSAWWLAHPTLVTPTLLLLGFALGDPALSRITLTLASDPEDEQLSTLEIGLLTADGDPDELQMRIEERALRAGALGVMADDKGAMLALTSAKAPST